MMCLPYRKVAWLVGLSPISSIGTVKLTGCETCASYSSYRTPYQNSQPQKGGGGGICTHGAHTANIVADLGSRVCVATQNGAATDQPGIARGEMIHIWLTCSYKKYRQGLSSKVRARTEITPRAHTATCYFVVLVVSPLNRSVLCHRELAEGSSQGGARVRQESTTNVRIDDRNQVEPRVRRHGQSLQLTCNPARKKKDKKQSCVFMGNTVKKITAVGMM